MTKEEKMMRRSGITAAEAVAIAGLSTMTATEVYRRKLRPTERIEIEPSEKLILARYAKLTRLRLGRSYSVERNSRRRFAICEPIIFGSSDSRDHRIVRCVTARTKKVSEAMRLEAIWEMDTRVMDFDFAILVGARLHIVPIEFNGDDFDRLYAGAEHFMVESVLQRIPPVEAK